MIVQLAALTVDAAAPLRLATFWAGRWAGGRTHADATVIVPHDDTGFVIRFLPSDAPKVVANQVHLDLRSGSQQEQDDTVARALALGGRHIDIGQLPEEEHVVLADPEGNELCVVEAGNGFLADCPFVGCLSSDGTRDLGRFWSGGPGLATRVGPGRGDRDPLSARRAQDLLGRGHRSLPRPRGAGGASS